MANVDPNAPGVTVTLGVRPARVGVLVPVITGISWMRTFEAALAGQCGWWGGSANIVLPQTPGLTEHPLFWALGDRLDADAWVCWQPTVADMETLNPRRYEQVRTHVRKQMDGASAEDFEQEWVRLLDEPMEVDGPTDTQCADLTAVCAPLHHTPTSPPDFVSNGSGPQWPHTSVSDFAGLPERVLNPNVTGAAASLLLTAEVGRVDAGLERRLAARGVSVVTRKLERLAWLRLLSERDPDTYPLSLAEMGLSWYLPRPFKQAPVAVVVGDSAWDFALFYALRRWTSRAFWMPSALQRHPVARGRMTHLIARWARRSASEVVVTTSQTSAEGRDQLARTLSGLVRRRDQVHSVAWGEALPDVSNRLFETDNIGRPLHMPFVGDHTAQLPTPTPKAVACKDDSEMRWMTEVTVDGWSPVRNPKLAGHVIEANGYESELARTTRTGVAYFCPHFFWSAGTTLDAATVRPRLRCPSLLDQLRILLANTGWVVEPSDKGIYAAGTVEMFGSAEDVRIALRDPVLGRLLRAFVQKSAPGIELAAGRLLSVQHIEELLGKDDAGLALKRLAAADVLTRGLVLSCRRCRRTAWYALADMGPDFRCTRCRHEQSVEGRWRGGVEPVWFYRLDEVVRQFLEHNGDLPLIAAQQRFMPSPTAVAIEHELAFVNAAEDVDCEIDVVVGEGHRLWVGEASKSGRFKPSRRQDNLLAVARGLDAYGVVLITSRNRIAEAPINALQPALKRERIELDCIVDALAKAD